MIMCLVFALGIVLLTLEDRPIVLLLGYGVPLAAAAWHLRCAPGDIHAWFIAAMYVSSLITRGIHACTS